MELDQLAKHNYFVRHNELHDDFYIMRADRNGNVAIVQTNIRTEEKAQKACKEWCEREMLRMTGEVIGLMAEMMKRELERQFEENADADVDLRLLAATALAGMQVYIHRNAPAARTN